MAKKILGYGFVITASVLSAFFYVLYERHATTATAVSVAFLSLALAQLWHVFNMVPSGSGTLRSQVVRNGFVWGAIVLCLVLLLVAMYWQPAASILSLVPLAKVDLTIAVLASAVPLLVGTVYRAVTNVQASFHNRRSET